MRRRIMLLVVGMTALVVLAFAIPVALLIRTGVEQRNERSMRDQAQAVARFLGYGNPSAAAVASYLDTLPQSEDRRTSVTMPNGTVLGTQDPSEGDQHGGPPPEGDRHGEHLGGAPPGDAQLRNVAGGKVAELTVASDDSSYLVRVYMSSTALNSGVMGWYALLAAGSAGLLVLAGVGAELLTRRIVRPLTRTADTAHQLSVGDVSARAPTEGPPEVAAVGVALNRLADRIDELIAEERETVADLSHRLRTPLTALRLDAEALRDPEEAEQLSGDVSSLERTLTAVIRSARRPQREGRLPAADATTVVASRVAFWSALAEEQERTTTVSLPGTPLPVRTSIEDLGAAVDALVENVIAHTPEGTPFSVTLSPGKGGGATLVVADAGPGLPEGSGVRGRSDRGSSGLGLDIARRCAEASGGSMRVQRAPSGGASVTLELGEP